MTSEAARHTARVFGPLFALIIGVVIGLSLALWFEAPRPVTLTLGAVLITALIIGPYVWFAIRFVSTRNRIPLLWTAEDLEDIEDSDDSVSEEIHLSWFSPRAWQRKRAKDELVKKQGDTGPVYLGRNLRKEEVEPPMQTEPVERYVVDGTWRGAIDWWSVEVSANAYKSMYERLVPKARRAARIEGDAATRSLEETLDNTAAILAGVEEDTLYKKDVDGKAGDSDLADIFEGDLAAALDQEDSDEPDDSTPPEPQAEPTTNGADTDD